VTCSTLTSTAETVRRITYTAANRPPTAVAKANPTTGSAPLTVGNTPPTATINTPAAGTTWKVGDVIGFSGSATDPQDGTLPTSALTWDLILHHCPSTCHTHLLQSFDGVASGSLPRPTTSTRRTWSCGSPPPTPAA
jgi:hypothetical protein